MIRRQYIKTAGAAVTGGALAGCAASDPGATTDSDETTDNGTGTEESSEDARSEERMTGTLATSVTDQPVDIGDFESCVITIDGLWVKPDGTRDEGEATRSEADPEEVSEGSATPESDGGTSEAGDARDADTENDGGTEEGDGAGRNEEREEPAIGAGRGPEEHEGRRYVGFDKPQEADLVRLQGANTQLIDETELAVGEYRYLQLDVGGVEGVLSEGGEAEIDTPGNAPLQFKQRFEIRSNERTGFVADFAPVRRGQGNRYLLRPVATGTRVLYGDDVYDPEMGETDESGETDGIEGSKEDNEDGQGAAGATDRASDGDEEANAVES